MRLLLIASLCAGCCWMTGCAAMTAGRDVAESSVSTFKPRSRDYRDDANFDDEIHDEWSMRQEARGDHPGERESDKLTNIIESPKARAINRSLGID